MTSFQELEAAVVEAPHAGEIHLYTDIKPEPRNWRQELELAFYRAEPCAVTDSIKIRLTSIAAPQGREVRLNDVAYPEGHAAA